MKSCFTSILTLIGWGALAFGAAPAVPGLTVGAAVSVMAPAAVLNVRDFGAVGDGKADDSAAVQKAMRSAGRPDPGNPQKTRPTTVRLPAGTYRLTQTLVLGPEDRLNRLDGEGGQVTNGKGYTTLLWDGAAGEPLFKVQGYLGVRIAELRFDGNAKAGVLLRVNSVPGVGTGLLYVDRCTFANAATGMEFGADLDSCAGDMTFVDLNFTQLTEAGFRTMANQNVDYVFIRPIFTHMPVGVHFKRGGNGHFLLPCFGRVNTCFKMDETSGGINGGVYSITGLQLENFRYRDEKKRFTILDAAGETNVSLQSIFTSCTNVWGKDADLETPNFILGPSAQVSIRDAMISGRIATLTGTSRGPATWLQFDNCRFRCAADPFKSITADAWSGCELRNCHVTLDDTRAEDYNKNQTSFMIPQYRRLPEQATRQPQAPAK